MSTSSNNAPVFIHRDGPIFAKIWRNETEKGGAMYNTTIGKLYTDPQTGETREGQNYNKEDLLKLQFLMIQSYSTISEMQSLKVEQEHVHPTITKEHSGLQAQRDAALSNVPKTPNAESGIGPAPTQIHAPEM